MTQQGYGPGPDPNAPPMNPYAPPVNALHAPQGFVPTVETNGSFGLGFAAGFFGGCIGLILVRVIAKGSETKRGATIGFVVQAAIGLVLRLVLAASG
jgi:hypothetical protein